jgi:hypothetical protein
MLISPPRCDSVNRQLTKGAFDSTLNGAWAYLYRMRKPDNDVLGFGIIAAILAMLMFASIAHQSDFHSSIAIENAAAKNR